MSDLENRIKKLEGGYPKHWTVKELPDDEMAELITGIPGTKADDLTDEYLQAVARGEKPTLP